MLVFANASGGAVSTDLFSISALGALLTLTLMEIVLGIDNVVFVAILVGKLPREKQKVGRTVGMTLALGLRLGLLLGISWVMGLTKTLIAIPESLRPEDWSHFTPVKDGLTGKDLIMLAGGL